MLRLAGPEAEGAQVCSRAASAATCDTFLAASGTEQLSPSCVESGQFSPEGAGSASGSASGSVSGSQSRHGSRSSTGCHPILWTTRHVFGYFRRAWKGVRFKDPELDEFEPNALRYKPDHIETLCKSTKFSKKEIQLMYRGFKQECPSGTVNEDTFKYIYSRFFPQGDSNAYAHHVFNTFDTDHTGTINFEEFVTALSALSRGDMYDKLRWAFSLYDINGDGYITKDEMLDVVGSVYMLVGRHSSPAGDEVSTKQHVDRIFERMDINRDGVVTLDEFLELCSNDETIAQSLNLLDTCF